MSANRVPLTQNFMSPLSLLRGRSYIRTWNPIRIMDTHAFKGNYQSAVQITPLTVLKRLTNLLQLLKSQKRSNNGSSQLMMNQMNQVKPPEIEE